MSFPFNITNPGFSLSGLLTSIESEYVTNLVLAGGTAVENEVLTWKSGAPSWEAPAGGGYTNLTQFVAQTPWRLFYSNSLGDVTELALGADGTYLKSNGAAVAPTFATIAGTGDVVGPGVAVDSNFASFNTTTGKLIKDSGSKASDFATSGHNHTGTYAPALGTDDNYVTDAEKTALHSHSNKTVLDNSTASFTTAQETKLSNITGTNSGDQTSIVGITGTFAQFNTAVTDANLARTDAANTFTGIQTFSTPIAATSLATMTATVGGIVPTPPNNTTTFLRGDGTFAAPSSGFADPLTTNGDIIARIAGATTRLAQGGDGTFLGVSGGTLGYYTPAGGGYTDEQAQDAVGAMVDSSLTYVDATPLLQRAALTGAITAPAGDNTTSLGSFTAAQLDTAISDNTGVYTARSNAFTFGNQSISTAVSTPLTLNQNDSVTPRYAFKTVNAGPGAYGASFENTHSGAAGSAIQLYHNSSSPAAGDINGAITFAGNNSAASYAVYGSIYTLIEDETSGSENGQMQLEVIDNGTPSVVFTASSNGTIVIGKSTSTGILSSNVNQDLQLRTGNAITGFIVIADGADGNITFSPNGTGKVISGKDLEVPDEAYGAGWNGSLEVPTKNALYDKIETLGTGGGASTIYTDQTPDNGTYGLLSGTVNGSNTVFTVSEGAYTTGKLTVYRNGQLMTQGASNDFQETTPGSGTFTFITAPATGDVITAVYQNGVTADGIIAGQATLNFGAVTIEDSIARLTISTGSVTTSSVILVSPSGVATADHDTDDYQWDNISGYASNIVDGVSFDIVGVAPNGTWGQYKFNYSII